MLSEGESYLRAETLDMGQSHRLMHFLAKLSVRRNLGWQYLLRLSQSTFDHFIWLAESVNTFFSHIFHFDISWHVHMRLFFETNVHP